MGSDDSKSIMVFDVEVLARASTFSLRKILKPHYPRSWGTGEVL